MNTQKERLLSFIEALGFSMREFERTLGVSNGTVRHMSDTLSANLKDKISANFPQLNMDWLLLGSGEMLPSGITPSFDTEEFEYLQRRVAELEMMVATMQKLIKKYEDEIDSLKGGNVYARAKNA